MASRTLLLGIVPVWTQTPPIIMVRSITATRLRILAAQMAPFCPAGPLPITIRSNCWSAMGADTLSPINIAHNAAVALSLPAEECDPARCLFGRGWGGEAGKEVVQEYLTA